MHIFIGLTGFAGGFIFLILLVINAIKKKPKKKSFIGLSVCFVLFATGIMMTPIGSNSSLEAQLEPEIKAAKIAEKPSQEEAITEEDTEEEKESVEPVKEVKEEPTQTLSQKNAVRKAETYLTIMAFSKSGLVEQLEFDGFSNEDSTYAVNNIDVDWKAQAVSKGKTYLDLMAFSRSGLIEQLEFDGFSAEEATYAVDQIGL